MRSFRVFTVSVLITSFSITLTLRHEPKNNAISRATIAASAVYNA